MAVSRADIFEVIVAPSKKMSAFLEICLTRGCAYYKCSKGKCVPTMNLLNTGRIHASLGLSIHSLKNFHEVWIIFISINSQKFQIICQFLYAKYQLKGYYVSISIHLFHPSLTPASRKLGNNWYSVLLDNQGCVVPIILL